MHPALRTLLLAIGLGLAIAPSATADEALLDLFVARDACGGQTAPNVRLDTQVGPYTGNCGSTGSNAGPVTVTYSSATLPTAALDTTREIYVAVGLSTQGGLVAFGDQTVEIALTAKDAKNKTVTLGTASAVKPAADMLRGGNYTQEFALPLTAAKGGPFKAYTLDLTVGGSVLAGYVNHGGGSLVSLPMFDTFVLPGTEE